MTSRNFPITYTTMYSRSRDKKDTGRRPRRRSDSSLTRRRSCYFCDNKIEHIGYKDSILRNFVTEKGRIAPAKISGVCHRHQRRLARAIKQARTLAMLPYTAL